MEYTICSDQMKVVIEAEGGQLKSIQDAEGHEYLWQRDSAYWDESAPNLFPYIGRTTGGHYTFRGRSYEMSLHGFIRQSILKVENQTDDGITFMIQANEETRQRYPFEFVYKIHYKVEASTLSIIYEVQNLGKEKMYFGIGGHPGFCVPMEEGLTFEDYFIEFEKGIPGESEVVTNSGENKKSELSRIIFSDTAMVAGRESYELDESNRINLTHPLFDGDAIVLDGAPKSLTIRSEKGIRQVKVTYPDMRYIGFWHMDHTDAPYVCVEPWSSLPSKEGLVAELTSQKDLIGLDGSKSYFNCWSVEIS